MNTKYDIILIVWRHSVYDCHFNFFISNYLHPFDVSWNTDVLAQDTDILLFLQLIYTMSKKRTSADSDTDEQSTEDSECKCLSTLLAFSNRRPTCT